MADSGSDKHFAHAVTVAIEALKSMLFVNGGAATALIALMTKSNADFVLPVLLFGTAALLNSVTLILGYFSQLAYANGRQAVESGDHRAVQAYDEEHHRWQKIAVVLVLMSLGASAAGMTTALFQIEHPACVAKPEASLNGSTTPAHQTHEVRPPVRVR